MHALLFIITVIRAERFTGRAGRERTPCITFSGPVFSGLNAHSLGLVLLVHGHGMHAAP
jgi:hypothetical protein